MRDPAYLRMNHHARTCDSTPCQLNFKYNRVHDLKRGTFVLNVVGVLIERQLRNMCKSKYTSTSRYVSDEPHCDGDGEKTGNAHERVLSLLTSLHYDHAMGMSHSGMRPARPWTEQEANTRNISRYRTVITNACPSTRRAPLANASSHAHCCASRSQSH